MMYILAWILVGVLNMIWLIGTQYAFEHPNTDIYDEDTKIVLCAVFVLGPAGSICLGLLALEE